MLSGMSEVPRLVPLADALMPLLAASRAAAVVEVATAEALGRIAAAPVHAPAAFPPSAIALRDGLAVSSAALVGASPYAPALLTDHPVAVRAGAALPAGTDAVIPADAANSSAGFVEIGQSAYPGEAVVPAGGDLAAGTLLVRRGDRISPEQQLALAAIGRDSIAVYAATFAVAPASAPAIGAWLSARLSGLGLARCPPAKADIVVGSGAAAAGPDAGLAAPTAVRLALRPGDTADMAAVAGRTPVIMVPDRFDGAVAASFALLLPLAARLTGRAVNTKARPLARKIASAVGFTEIALLRTTADGSYEPLAVGQISLATLLAADAVALIPPESEGAAAGTLLAAIPIDDPLMPETDAG
jgi:molybdopterin molybdotransferase